MIDMIGEPNTDKFGYVIKPNQSMTWRGLICAYSAIAFVTLSVGVFFYWHGLKLILPFSGLEVIFLGLALYITAWRGGMREVVMFRGDTVTVERGIKGPEARYEFKRPWAQIVLERSWNSWYPSRLLIRSHGQQVEIGRFLNEQERQGLAKLLGKAMPQYNAAIWPAKNN